MASFTFDGLSDLQNMFDSLANVPTDVLENMLDAQSEVVIKAQKANAPKNTGTMEKSIKPSKKIMTIDGLYTYIYPQGIHHTSKKSRYRITGTGNRKVTNAEVGFIHEFGAKHRNIKETQWMRVANENSAAETTAVAQEVYDDWVEKL